MKGPAPGSLTRTLEKRWPHIERCYREEHVAYNLYQTAKRYRRKRKAERRWTRALKRMTHARKMGW